jgi:hypothetical protein
MVESIENLRKSHDSDLVRNLVHFLLTTHTLHRVVKLPSFDLVLLEL